MADAVGVSKKGEKKKIIFLIIFIIVAIVAVVLWWLNYRKYISTDDANLDTYRITGDGAGDPLVRDGGGYRAARRSAADS